MPYTSTNATMRTTKGATMSNIVFEGKCSKCGETTFQDEYYTLSAGLPEAVKVAYDRACAEECGGYVDAWVLSDEPHPEVWQ